jgi:WD40 repeat protein
LDKLRGIPIKAPSKREMLSSHTEREQNELVLHNWTKKNLQNYFPLDLSNMILQFAIPFCSTCLEAGELGSWFCYFCRTPYTESKSAEIDYKSYRCIRTLKGHNNWVKCLSPLPGGLLASSSYDHTIKIWDWKQKKTPLHSQGT